MNYNSNKNEYKGIVIIYKCKCARWPCECYKNSKQIEHSFSVRNKDIGKLAGKIKEEVLRLNPNP